MNYQQQPKFRNISYIVKDTQRKKNFDKLHLKVIKVEENFGALL